jgi:hypothetical protein
MGVGYEHLAMGGSAMNITLAETLAWVNICVHKCELT